MPGASTAELGNTAFSQVIYGSLTPPATVITNSSTVSTYTVNGLLPNDIIDLYAQANIATSTTYLTIGAVWCSAVNTLSVQWVNSTSASSSGTPTAIGFIIQIVRSTLSGYVLNSANWPTALV